MSVDLLIISLHIDRIKDTIVLRFKSVKTRIATLSALCLLSAATILVGWNLFMGHQTGAFVQAKTEAALDQDAQVYLGSVAAEQARNIRLELRTAIDAARDFATNFAILAGSEFATPAADRRALFNRMLESVLQRDTSLNGTYSAWEPNAIDGQDEAYRNRRETGTDATGRFLAISPAISGCSRSSSMTAGNCIRTA